MYILYFLLFILGVLVWCLICVLFPDHFNGTLGWHWIFPGKGKEVLRRKRSEREKEKKRLKREFKNKGQQDHYKKYAMQLFHANQY